MEEFSPPDHLFLLSFGINKQYWTCLLWKDQLIITLLVMCCNNNENLRILILGTDYFCFQQHLCRKHSSQICIHVWNTKR